MFARITSFKLAPGKFDEGMSFFKDTEKRMKAGEVPGFSGAWAFFDEKNSQIITHTYWENEEASRAYEKSALRQEVMGMMPDLMVGDFDFGVYEVVFFSQPEFEAG